MERIARDLAVLSQDARREISWQDIHDQTPRVNPGACHKTQIRPDIGGLVTGFQTLLGTELCWGHFVVVVELKGPNWQKHYILTFIQLDMYAEQVLIDQPDRSFCFGLLFHKAIFQVWLFDRSGAIGSQRYSWLKVGYP